MSANDATLYTYDELLSADFSTTYLIDPILPRGGVGLVYGKGGHGKTQLVFRLIKDITEGRPFLGLWEVEPAKVLFLQADMPAGLFQERARKAAPAMEAAEQIYFAHLDPLNILEPAAQRTVSEMVEAVEPDLVVYDTLHKLHHEDENESSTPRIVYDAWKEAIGARDGVTSILIHHSRKGFFYQGSFIDSNQDLRGHSGWRDDADLSIRVKKDRDEDQECHMAFTRLRCAAQPSVHLRFNPETLIIEPEPSSLKAEVVAIRYLNNGGQSDDLRDYLQSFGFSQTHSYRIAQNFSSGA